MKKIIWYNNKTIWVVMIATFILLSIGMLINNNTYWEGIGCLIILLAIFIMMLWMKRKKIKWRIRFTKTRIICGILLILVNGTLLWIGKYHPHVYYMFGSIILWIYLFLNMPSALITNSIMFFVNLIIPKGCESFIGIVLGILGLILSSLYQFFLGMFLGYITEYLLGINRKK